MSLNHSKTDSLISGVWSLNYTDFFLSHIDMKVVKAFLAFKFGHFAAEATRNRNSAQELHKRTSGDFYLQHEPDSS